MNISFSQLTSLIDWLISDTWTQSVQCIKVYQSHLLCQKIIAKHVKGHYQKHFFICLSYKSFTVHQLVPPPKFLTYIDWGFPGFPQFSNVRRQLGLYQFPSFKVWGTGHSWIYLTTQNVSETGKDCLENLSYILEVPGSGTLGALKWTFKIIRMVNFTFNNKQYKTRFDLKTLNDIAICEW